MKTSRRTMAIASALGAVLLAAPLAMAKDESSANDTNTANVETKTKHVAYLGVGVEPMHPAFWAHLRDVLEHKQGVMVAQVAKDSPAESAGIESHDILMTYGDQKLFSPEQLAALVQADKVGREVKLGIVRGGKSQEITATLGEHAMHSAERASRRPTWRPPWFSSAPAGKNTRWESFDSLTLKSLGDDRYRVEISYETKDGKIEHRMYEGTREEIHKDIMAQRDLPANEREHLLRSLDMPSDEFQFDDFQFGPGVYYTPDGRLTWDFGHLDGVFWPTLPSDF